MARLPNAAEAADLVAALDAVARDAGAAILGVYESDFAVRDKDDRSPVTDADEKAERLILARLAALTPDIPVVGEESVAAGHVPDIGGGRFWLVDPLDGTREFINRNGEFTVNIALVVDGTPVLGVVYAPALGALYAGAGPGTATRTIADSAPAAIAARPAPADGLVAVASRSHRDARTDEFLATMAVRDFTAAGSSLKFCLVAAGEADVYPRLGRTMEWDTAAGHAVLNAAGGSVRTLEGAPLGYGKPGFENPFFVARGRD
jgi:3'(2'), 5'-bisphosphate nucleotidase